MKQLLQNAFRTQIESLQGTDFEEFIAELLLLKYGTDGYIPIRGTGDKGNDGTILPEKKIIACYAPKKYNQANFKKKVLEIDFPKYTEFWKAEYPHWEMYINHEVTPDQLNLIENLEDNTSIIGIKQILHIIDNDLTTKKKRKLAKFLGIEEFFKQDYISDIIDDLLDRAQRDTSISYDRTDLTPPKEKIELNFEKEDWDTINSEMALLMEDFNIISNLLSEYEDSEKTLIKRRVVSDYNTLNGDFKTRLNNLTQQYLSRYGNDDDDGYRLSIRAILFYMFEQCLIGKKL